MTNERDDFFQSNNVSSSKVNTSVRTENEEVIVARKSLGKAIGDLLLGILIIAGGAFLIYLSKDLDVLLIPGIVVIGIGAIILFVGILGTIRPMDLAVIKGNKIWIYKKGEFELGSIVKVVARTYIQNIDSKNLLLSTRTTHGKMIFKLDNGKKIVLRDVEQVRTSVRRLNDLLGL